MGLVVQYVIGVLFWLGVYKFLGLNLWVTLIAIVIMTVITLRKAVLMTKKPSISEDEE